MSAEYIILVNLAAIPLGFFIICALFACVRSSQISREEETAQRAQLEQERRRFYKYLDAKEMK